MNEGKTLAETFDEIVGDTPVSVQLDAALKCMAKKEHTHENLVSREEFEILKADVEKLLQLVGDTSVAAQIGAAINQK